MAMSSTVRIGNAASMGCSLAEQVADRGDATCRCDRAATWPSSANRKRRRVLALLERPLLKIPVLDRLRGGRSCKGNRRAIAECCAGYLCSPSFSSSSSMSSSSWITGLTTTDRQKRGDTRLQGLKIAEAESPKRKFVVAANLEGRQVDVSTSRQDLTGKTVVVVGLGVSGKAAVKLALARGANVVAVDRRTDIAALEETLFKSEDAGRLRTELGSHPRDAFLDASMVVLSPGVPLSEPTIAEAIGLGIPTVSETVFAAQSLPPSIKIAAITGTNGKSTVTTFTGQLTAAAGIKSFVGGNLGCPLSIAALDCLAFPEDSPPYQAAIVEMSSYQLEHPGFFKPKVGVITNLTPDHLDHHKDMLTYAYMKCRLFKDMDKDDVAIIPVADPVLRKLASNAGGSGTRAWLGGLPGVQLDSQSRRAVVVVPTTGEEARLYLTSLRAVGAHNAVNAGTAALLAMSLDVGITGKTIQDAICQLQPPPHRMEIVFQDDKNVTWINDSKATNVDAAVVGINGIVGRKAVVLLGGLGKPVSTSEDGVVRYGFGRLASALAPHRAVVAFGAQGKSVQEELCAAGVTLPIEREETMVAAVERAGRLVEPGDVVLLSPACASFDEFNDFTHRGRVFAELANGSSKN